MGVGGPRGSFLPPSVSPMLNLTPSCPRWRGALCTNSCKYPQHTPSPLQRSLGGKLPLSPPVFKLLSPPALSRQPPPQPAACCPMTLGASPLSPHADPGVFLPSPEMKRKGGWPWGPGSWLSLNFLICRMAIVGRGGQSSRMTEEEGKAAIRPPNPCSELFPPIHSLHTTPSHFLDWIQSHITLQYTFIQ